MKKKFSMILNYIVTFVAAIVLMTGAVPVYSEAAASAANTTGSLTLTHKYTDDAGNVTALEGVTSKIYKVADFDGNTKKLCRHGDSLIKTISVTYAEAVWTVPLNPVKVLFHGCGVNSGIL